MTPIAERPELGRDNGGSPKGKAPPRGEGFDEALRDALSGKKAANSEGASTTQQPRTAEPGIAASTAQGLATAQKTFEPLQSEGTTAAPQRANERMGLHGEQQPARRFGDTGGVTGAAEMDAAAGSSSSGSSDRPQPSQGKEPAATVISSLAEALGKGSPRAEATTHMGKVDAAIEGAGVVDAARSRQNLDAGPGPAPLAPPAGPLQPSAPRPSVATSGPPQGSALASELPRRSLGGETPAVLERGREAVRSSGPRDGEQQAVARSKSAGLAAIVHALNTIAEHGNTPFAEVSIRAALANAAPGGAALVPEVLRRETHLAPVRLGGLPPEPSFLALGAAEPAAIAQTSSPAEQLKSALFVELRSPSTAAGPLKLAAASPSSLGQGPVRILELALKPASLGTIAVTLQLTPQGLRLSLQTTSRDAVAALEGDLDGLADLFADAGYAVQDVLVELAPPSMAAALSSTQPVPVSREGQPEPSTAPFVEPIDPQAKGPFTV